MIKELNNTTYQAFNGLLSTRFELNASFQSNIHKAFTLTCRGFFDCFRSIQPQSSLADYIELKTTSGGLTLIKSITQNSIIKSLIKCMQYLADNLRPHVIFNNAINLTKTLS
jgi:hypothetical protein